MSALPPKADMRQHSYLMSFESSVVSLERAPCRYFPSRSPSGEPPGAPWKRQTVQPFKA
jgi:hypothetical protein